MNDQKPLPDVKVEEAILRIKNPLVRVVTQLLLGVGVGAGISVFAIWRQQMREMRSGTTAPNPLPLNKVAVAGAVFGGLAVLILLSRGWIKGLIGKRREQHQSTWWLHLLLFLVYFGAFVMLLLALALAVSYGGT